MTEEQLRREALKIVRWVREEFDHLDGSELLAALGGATAAILLATPMNVRKVWIDSLLELVQEQAELGVQE